MPPQHPNCRTQEILHTSCGHILFIKANDIELHDHQGRGAPELCMLGHYYYGIAEGEFCERCQMVHMGARSWEEATEMAYYSIVEYFVSNVLPFTFQFHSGDTEYSLDPQIIAERISTTRALVEAQAARRLIEAQAAERLIEAQIAAEREEAEIIQHQKLERIQAIIQPVVGNPRGEACIICLQDWENQGDGQEGEVPVKLPCEHEYGENCITKWLMTNGSCPECRAKFVD